MLEVGGWRLERGQEEVWARLDILTFVMTESRYKTRREPHH